MANLKDIAENIKKNNLAEALNLCDDCDDVNNQHIISNFRGVIYLIKENLELSEENFLKSLKMINPSMSFAGVESTMLSPAETSHYLLTPEDRIAQGITDNLIRFSETPSTSLPRTIQRGKFHFFSCIKLEIFVCSSKINLIFCFFIFFAKKIGSS